jgi:hypothetical protein
MGVTLFDLGSDEPLFDVNFWNWRAIVETIRSLAVIDTKKVDLLHEPFLGELTRDEARSVARALRERVLLGLTADERVLLDGTKTSEPDDGTFFRGAAEAHKNYSTSRRVLEAFVAACEACEGFRVG